MDGYRSADWARFRAEAFRLADYACTKCSRSSKTDGVVLQLHHTRYIPGRRPWEYPHSLCEVVCRYCHAAEHGIVPPGSGWEHVAWDDLGGLDGSCECCGTQIRYVFFIQHPKWQAMEVGEICCDHLTNTEHASEHMKNRRLKHNRLKTFVSSSAWKVDRFFSSHSIKRDKFSLCIVPSDPRPPPKGQEVASYRIWVDGTLGRLEFPTVLEAKMKLFELLDSGQLSTYRDRPRRPRPLSPPPERSPQ